MIHGPTCIARTPNLHACMYEKEKNLSTKCVSFNVPPRSMTGDVVHNDGSLQNVPFFKGFISSILSSVLFQACHAMACTMTTPNSFLGTRHHLPLAFMLHGKNKLNLHYMELVWRDLYRLVVLGSDPTVSCLSMHSNLLKQVQEVREVNIDLETRVSQLTTSNEKLLDSEGRWYSLARELENQMDVIKKVNTRRCCDALVCIRVTRTTTSLVTLVGYNRLYLPEPL